MKSFKSLQLLVVAVVLSIGSGCASVTRGSYDTLVVESTPSQAKVEVYRTNDDFTSKELEKNMSEEEAKVINEKEEGFAGPITGKTPASFKLARKGNYKVTISKEGYETAEVRVINQISNAGASGMAGNILLGGVIGAGVDASTGAMKDLVPNPIQVTLNPFDVEVTPEANSE